MSSAVRYSDLSTGHTSWTSTSNHSGSDNVFINGLPSHRVGDEWDQHCSPNCHSGVSVEGSSTVYINNRQAMRVGDPISCGDFAMTGSDDVFIGPNDRYKDT